MPRYRSRRARGQRNTQCSTIASRHKKIGTEGQKNLRVTKFPVRSSGTVPSCQRRVPQNQWILTFCLRECEEHGGKIQQPSGTEGFIAQKAKNIRIRSSARFRNCQAKSAPPSMAHDRFRDTRGTEQKNSPPTKQKYAPRSPAQCRNCQARVPHYQMPTAISRNSGGAEHRRSTSARGSSAP